MTETERGTKQQSQHGRDIHTCTWGSHRAVESHLHCQPQAVHDEEQPAAVLSGSGACISNPDTASVTPPHCRLSSPPPLHREGVIRLQLPRHRSRSRNHCHSHCDAPAARHR